MKFKVMGKFNKEHKLYVVGEILSASVVQVERNYFVMFKNNSDKVVYSLSKIFKDKTHAEKRMKQFLSESMVEITQ
jgi:hypothetical protein